MLMMSIVEVNTIRTPDNFQVQGAFNP